MVPIYDSDVAEKRWAQKEWEQYEFWEDVEARNRKIRRRWVGFAIVLFLIFSSIPVALVRFQKWKGVRLARQLSITLNEFKRDAALGRQAIRVIFEASDPLVLKVERLENCESSAAISMSTVALDRSEGFAFLLPIESSRFELNGVLSGLCFDPLRGLYFSEGKEYRLASLIQGSKGVVILPANDLTEGRSERLTVIGVRGESAEISFE